MTPQRVDPHAACGKTSKDTRPANATVDVVSERSATQASVEGKMNNRTPKRIEDEIVRGRFILGTAPSHVSTPQTKMERWPTADK